MSGPPPGTRVLIVEDEMIIAMTVEDMIEEMGGIVAGTATTLAQALDCAQAGGFDVAILDVNLNGEPSLAVARRLAETGVPFLFTTGYGNLGACEDFADAVVVKKPYRLEELAEAVARTLEEG